MRIDDDENQISIYDMKPIINEEEETIEAVKLSAEEQDEKSESEQSTESL